ncbi:MAG: hypothetical protein J7J82_03885 [Staphylothermus sp.]|nr:hypothetical protein [Staphylothermus sp.]
MSKKKEWWNIKGVPSPVHINYKKSKTAYLSLLLAVAFLLVFFLELFQYVPSGLSVVVLSLGIILQGVSTLLGIVNPSTGLRVTDIRYIESLMRTLNGFIRRWSVPSITIPVAATISNGIYMFIAKRKGSLKIYLLKPVIYYRVMSGKPVFKIKWVQKTKYYGLTMGIADLTVPHPELRNTNYYLRAKVVEAPTTIDPVKIYNFLKEFDIVVNKGMYHGGDTTDRRHTYTRQSYKSTREIAKHYRGW